MKMNIIYYYDTAWCNIPDDRYLITRCRENLKSYSELQCLKFEDAFVITCVAIVMEVKVLYIQQDLQYEITSYWCFNV
jgi:hypothetical protein